jgi:predicted Zn-dependent protease
VLAARTSPDAAMAVAMGGQGLAIQRQLNFSREAEREADRVGFQILNDSGFDTAGMVSFFGRLQASMRNYTDNAPAYLRSHPLTSERIADIQARMLDQRYRQRADSLAFYLTKARIRVLQDSTIQGLMDAKVFFETQIRSEKEEDKIAGTYGLAFVAFKQLDFANAKVLLEQAKTRLEKSQTNKNILNTSSMFASLAIDIQLGSKQFELAAARKRQCSNCHSRAVWYINTLRPCYLLRNMRLPVHTCGIRL